MLTQNGAVIDCAHCGPKPRRGRPPEHPLWFDAEAKVCKSHRQHPNASKCKNFLNNVNHPPDPDSPHAWKHGDAEHFRIVDRWLNVATFTYEMTCEAGILPDKWHIIWPKDPRQPVGPGNVVWLKHPKEGVREARQQQIAHLEAQEVIAEELSRADLRLQPDGSYLPGSIVDRLRHLPGCETQRQGLDPVECPCTETIREHYAQF